MLGPNSLMLKEGDLHAPRNIQGTQACDCSIPCTAGECFAVIFAMRGPWICMFGHLFMDAEPASDWADFMNPKHQMHTQRCFGMAISLKAQWRGLELFFWLSSYSDCACNAAFQGRSQCTQRIIHTPSEVSDTFCWPLCPYFAFPCIENIACDTNISPENSRHQKIKYNWIELFTSWYQHSGAVNDANQGRKPILWHWSKNTIFSDWHQPTLACPISLFSRE